MRKTTGSAAGLFALLAVFLHTQFAPQSETAPGAEKGGSGAGVEHHDPQAASDEAIPGPWIATQEYFQVKDAIINPRAKDKTIDASALRSYLQEVSHPKNGSAIKPENLAAFLGVDQAPDQTKIWSVIATVP